VNSDHAFPIYAALSRKSVSSTRKLHGVKAALDSTKLIVARTFTTPADYLAVAKLLLI
jgi:hypothetical protein